MTTCLEDHMRLYITDLRNIYYWYDNNLSIYWGEPEKGGRHAENLSCENGTKYCQIVSIGKKEGK